MAAAKGMMPLSNEEMLEVLVALASDENEKVRLTAATTIDTLDASSFLSLASNTEADAEVLGFLCLWGHTPREVLEPVIFNRSTPDAALARLAAMTTDPQILEAISVKQQSLIQTPDIIEAILNNPARTPEAERRAAEVRKEFFEKRFGAQMVAGEQRARAEAAKRDAAGAAVVIEGIEDLVRLGLMDAGLESEAAEDPIFQEYEAEFGPFNSAMPELDQTVDYEAIIGEVVAEEIGIEGERKAVFQQIALMSIKERVMLAIKGTREARMILVRDPNRVVACAVLRNPRLTDNEVEYISSIKTAPEDVLRQIGMNRAWTRSYTVIHNLVRNPRTPVALSLNFLNRIQARDLRNLASNKNIPDVIRTMANRMYLKRQS